MKTCFLPLTLVPRYHSAAGDVELTVRVVNADLDAASGAGQNPILRESDVVDVVHGLAARRNRRAGLRGAHRLDGGEGSVERRKHR
jgi:hypothetical protein